MTQWRNVASGGVARRGVDSVAGGHAMRGAQRLSVERVAMRLLRHRCLVRMRARCTVCVQRDDLGVLRVLAPLIAVTGLEARLHMHALPRQLVVPLLLLPLQAPCIWHTIYMGAKFLRAEIIEEVPRYPTRAPPTPNHPAQLVQYPAPVRIHLPLGI